MQISRIATIVAAGVITPALFLTTPAVAEEQPATTGQTTTQQDGGAAAPADTNPAPKADTGGKDDKAGGEQSGKGDGTAPFFNPLTLHGPGKKVVQAGPDKWAAFEMSFDNRKGDKDASFDLEAAYVPAKPNVGKVEDYAVALEYRSTKNSGWTHVDLVPSFSGENGPFRFTGSLTSYEVKKGFLETFELRLKLGERTPAHEAGLTLMDSQNHKISADQRFSVKAVEPKPEKSKSPTASASPTATESGKKNPDAKPSASASASASPSASSSTTAAAADTTSGGSGTTANGSRTELAATGSDPATPWIAAGGAAAIIAGAGLVVATRRRAGAQG
ncbi:hypothetical protein EKH77_11720 [Streptomyces luteoverticillatus]|uniref:LPXTG cell wall anchor domain-containing protein n=1 Tax=Streptomyces luteoverticillatus TaxID=66425 RepID=A0A3S9PHD0_STRLT|nr:LAETG motif-containing sortase-dependent surface protein [Streptomyces luteoverticillatus]AZQ71789.1 hypothetical protein EKH77_11720 [Streptomyces luteoverticillatus]